MSTITKERAAGIARGEKCYTHDDVVELARISLASLEAEAVYQVYGNNDDTWSDVDEEEMIRLSSDGEDTRTLYTTPPAPVSVPDDLTREEYKRRFMEDDDFDNTFRGGLNACRAAMLQSFGNSEQLDSPVIPDGWVACSERMPPPKTGVIVGCWFGRNWATKWATYLPYHPDAHQSGFLMPGGSWTPTHWMPIPAAPQQEN